MESKEIKKKTTVSSRVKKEKIEHDIVRPGTKRHTSKQVDVAHTEHVVHHKKKVPAHITASSIFASEFRKKKSTPVLTGASLLIILGLVFLYQSSRVSPSAPTDKVGVIKKTEYTNSIYGFSFKLPQSYSQVRESPDPKKCLDNRSWNGKPITSVTVAEIQNISVTVGCQKLSDSIIGQFSQEKVSTNEISVNGRKAYTHQFITKAGYFWQVVQVPLDDGHYLEISHNYKSKSEIIAPADLPLYKPLSEGEWTTLVTSLAFK